MIQMDLNDALGLRGTGGMALLALALALLLLSSSVAAVSVRADFSSTLGAPFPSNWFSVPDSEQITGLRVALPMPDCAVRVSDCQDLAVVNELDGFSAQPRITIPFTGAINLATVTSETVFLVQLGPTGPRARPHRIGLNQLQWDEISQTLIGTPDEYLAQHKPYLLVVTDGIKAMGGARINSEEFWRDLTKSGKDKASLAYVNALKTAIQAKGLQRRHLVAASLFTTQSVTVDLEKIRDQIKHSNPDPIDFTIGLDVSEPGSGQPSTPTRAVFATNAVTRILFHRQTGVGTPSGPQFTDSDVHVERLGLTPGAVAQVAFGRFSSPDYEQPGGYIPAYATRVGVPLPQRQASLVVEIFLPAGTRPKMGWPVALFGHGLSESLFNDPWAIASQLAAEGIATAAIEIVGHGGGKLGTLDVFNRDGHFITVPSGGRGIDQDDDGQISSTEGLSAVLPRSIVGSRDGRRQTVIDLIQLVREIAIGVDVSGDGGRDLDPNRIYYVGHSAGANYGTVLLALEPSVRAGALVCGGGSNVDIYRLGILRPILGKELSKRIPTLLNSATSEDPTKPTYEFIDNIPLRNKSIVTNTVPGATEIQQVIDTNSWVFESADPVAYAPYLRASPLPGNGAKRVLLIFAKGDRIVPNPTTVAIIRSGKLTDSTTLYRADLAYATNPSVMPNNPHNFFLDGVDTAEKPFALAAHRQIAAFFKTDGSSIIVPDGGSPIFETPLGGPLPEGLDFYP